MRQSAPPFVLKRLVHIISLMFAAVVNFSCDINLLDEKHPPFNAHGWETLKIPFDADNAQFIVYKNALYVMPGGSYTFKTTNNGLSWDTLSVNLNLSLDMKMYADSTYLYISDLYSLYRYSDYSLKKIANYGQFEITSSYQNMFFAVKLYDGYLSTDYGFSWTKKINSVSSTCVPKFVGPFIYAIVSGKLSRFSVYDNILADVSNISKIIYKNILFNGINYFSSTNNIRRSDTDYGTSLVSIDPDCIIHGKNVIVNNLYSPDEGRSWYSFRIPTEVRPHSSDYGRLYLNNEYAFCEKDGQLFRRALKSIR